MSPQSYANLSQDELRSMFDYLFVGQPMMTRRTFQKFQAQIIVLQQSWNLTTHAERTAQALKLVSEATRSANAPTLAQRLVTGQYVSQDSEFEDVERDRTRPRDRAYLTRGRCERLRREREAAEREGRPTTPPPANAQDELDGTPAGPIDSPMQPSTPNAPSKNTTGSGHGDDYFPAPSSDSGYVSQDEHDSVKLQLANAIDDGIRHLEQIRQQQQTIAQHEQTITEQQSTIANLQQDNEESEQRQQGEIAQHKRTISQQKTSIADLQQAIEEAHQQSRHLKDRIAEIRRKVGGALEDDDEQADKY